MPKRALKAFFAVAIFLILSPTSKANTLVPLEQYISSSDVEDPAVMSYIMLRCSAQLSYTGMLMQGNNESHSKDLIELGSTFGAYATILTNSQTKEDSDVISQRNMNAIEQMMQMHVKKGNANYVSSGSYLDDADFENIAVCQSVREALF